MSAAPLQIGGSEWLWIVLVAIVLLFGADKLPEFAKALGKAAGEFQRGRREIERELFEAVRSPPGAPPGSEQAKLLNVARALGLDPTGKTTDQLREAIRLALEKKS